MLGLINFVTSVRILQLYIKRVSIEVLFNSFHMCCYAYLVRRKLAFPTLEHLCFLNHKHTFLCRTCRAKFLFEKQSDTYLHAIHNCHCHTGKYFLVCRDCEEEHLKDRIVVMPVIHIILGNGTDVQLLPCLFALIQMRRL